MLVPIGKFHSELFYSHRKNNNNSSRTTSPTKLIEAAVKGATYAGKFSLKGDVFECTKIKV